MITVGQTWSRLEAGFSTELGYDHMRMLTKKNLKLVGKKRGRAQENITNFCWSNVIHGTLDKPRT
jgi:hypothetical protein